jgi:hypothetical protein
MSLPWDRLLLLSFFGGLTALYLGWFAWHIWHGTVGVLLWRLGVAPEAYACLNVASTLALVGIKARKYDSTTPAVVLGNRNLKDADFLRLAEGVRSMPEAGIFLLDLSMNFGVSTSGVKAFLQALYDGKAPRATVEELDLSCLHIDPIATGLWETPLQQIHLKGCGFDAKQLVAIFLRITTASTQKKKRCDWLSHLDLSYNDFGAIRLDIDLPPLQVLALKSCNLRDNAVEALFGKGKLASSPLVEINLAENALTDNSSKTLAAQLPRSKIQELDLQGNKMTVKSFEPFIEVNDKDGFWCRVAFRGNARISEEAVRDFHTKFAPIPVCAPCLQFCTPELCKPVGVSPDLSALSPDSWQ